MASNAISPTPATQSAPISYNERRQRLQIRLLVWPATFWLILFFVIPFFVVVAYSFLTRSTRFQAVLPFTLDNYTQVLQDMSVLWRSVGIALLSTFICVLMGYPLAFFIATRPKRSRNIFLLMVIIPFWTNFLVRVYAWIFILRNEGLIDSFAREVLRITTAPLDMMFTPAAVIIVLVYGYLPFMVLPIYTSIEKFNFRWVEAANDLGANDLRAFLRVVLPVTLPGVLAGCILVFIPALGSFVVPDLVGGAQVLMIGNQITNVGNLASGKPTAAALSLVMMLVVVVALVIYYRYSDRSSAV